MKPLRTAVTIVVLLSSFTVLAETLEARQEFVERIFERENAMMLRLGTMRPVVETYLQTLDKDGSPGHYDLYYLGEWNVARRGSDWRRHRADVTLRLLPGITARTIGSYFDRYVFFPAETSQMFFVDVHSFHIDRFLLSYDGDEYLGAINCARFLVQPIPAAAGRKFLGRIWVEKSSASIVRIHGRYTADKSNEGDGEFDSWRYPDADGFWMPYYLYSEATDANPATTLVRLRVRMAAYVWGYKRHPEDAITSEHAPVLSRRGEQRTKYQPHFNAWLDANGLLAAPGPVDEVVCRVARKMMQAQGIQPKLITCRTLMSLALDAFTVGDTIFISRGVLDLLPDEASLAAVLAHEVAHIVLGHTDPYVNPAGNVFDSVALRSWNFHKDGLQEAQARAMAVRLVQASAYIGTLTRLQEFAAAVESSRKDHRNLFAARFGGHMSSEVVALAHVFPASMQIRAGALPLGSRIDLDPINNQIRFAAKYRGIAGRGFAFGVPAIVPSGQLSERFVPPQPLPTSGSH